MEHVVQFCGPVDDLKLSGQAGPIVLDLTECPELGTSAQSRLRNVFTCLVSKGMEVRLRGASPEVASELQHLRAQTLMRRAERANPNLFAQTG